MAVANVALASPPPPGGVALSGFAAASTREVTSESAFSGGHLSWLLGRNLHGSRADGRASPLVAASLQHQRRGVMLPVRELLWWRRLGSALAVVQRPRCA